MNYCRTHAHYEQLQPATVNFHLWLLYIMLKLNKLS